MPDTAVPHTEPAWAKPAISILALLVFLVLIAVAFLSHDLQSQAILSGVGAGMATQVLNYYLGSSSGSARKTDLLAAAAPVDPGVPKV
jgi:hypothetical protein